MKWPCCASCQKIRGELRCDFFDSTLTLLWHLTHKGSVGILPPTNWCTALKIGISLSGVSRGLYKIMRHIFGWEYKYVKTRKTWDCHTANQFRVVTLAPPRQRSLLNYSIQIFPPTTETQSKHESTRLIPVGWVWSVRSPVTRPSAATRASAACTNWPSAASRRGPPDFPLCLSPPFTNRSLPPPRRPSRCSVKHQLNREEIQIRQNQLFKIFF